MQLNDMLRAARERQGKTQGEIAQDIGVTVKTIEKWESDTRPERIFCNAVIRAYRLDRDEFARKFLDDIAPLPKVDGPDREFPDFLFSLVQWKSIHNMILTEEEQDLFGMELIYGGRVPEYTGTVKDEFNKGGKQEIQLTAKELTPLANLPYDYVKSIGTFRLLGIHNSLWKKIASNKEFVARYLIKHNAAELFDYRKLEQDDIITLLGRDRMKKLGEVVKLLKVAEANDGQTIVARKIEKPTFVNSVDSDTIVWELTEGAVGLVEGKNLQPFQRGTYYRRYLATNYAVGSALPEYFQIRNKLGDDDPEYLAAYADYQEKLNSGQELPPMPVIRDCLYAELTESGKKLLSWWKENVENAPSKEQLPK